MERFGPYSKIHGLHFCIFHHVLGNDRKIGFLTKIYSMNINWFQDVKVPQFRQLKLTGGWNYCCLPDAACGRPESVGKDLSRLHCYIAGELFCKLLVSSNMGYMNFPTENLFQYSTFPKRCVMICGTFTTKSLPLEHGF